MQKINFINDTTPALNATNLNKLQQNVEDDIGDLTELETSAKNNLVEAINEAASTGSGGDTLPIYSIVDYDGDTVPTGYEEVNSYSTSEVKTGDTWIDGKPIYRKVIQINSLPNNTETTYQTGIVNGETIKYQGFLSLTSGDVALQPMPYISPNQESGNVYYWIRKDATLIDVRTKADRTSASAYFIIEYTKTTD